MILVRWRWWGGEDQMALSFNMRLGYKGQMVRRRGRLNGVGVMVKWRKVMKIKWRAEMKVYWRWEDEG